MPPQDANPTPSFGGFGLKEGVLDAIIELLNGGVATISTGVILLAAAQLMRAGSFTVGDFSLFVYVAGGPNTIYALRWLGEFLASLRWARVSFERLLQLIPDRPPQALVYRPDTWWTGVRGHGGHI